MYRGRFIPDARSDAAGADAQAARIDRPPRAAADLAGKKENPTNRRIACILVADFPLAAIVRANPELRDQPLALTRMPAPRRAASGARGSAVHYHPHSELCDVSPVAQAAGVRVGMTVAQARALMPQLRVTHPSAAAERAAVAALADAAESISPVVEEGAPGCVWLDLTGLQLLHRPVIGADTQESPGEEQLEQTIAEEIARRVNRLGLVAAVGIAAHKEIAQLAARCGGVRIIAAGREREFLDWMPLELADLGGKLDGGLSGDELELRLKRLGLRRLGDLARLERLAVGSRLGEAGVRLARLARGEGSAIVNPRPRAESFVEAVELEYGIDNLEPLGFVLRGMLERITAQLQLRGLAAGDLTLSLGLADRRRDERRVAVAAATLEVRALLALLELNLAAAAPAAAVETIRLTVAPRRARPAQHDLFLPPAPAPDRLEAALARIAALCGPDRVGTLLPADSYRPEAVRLGVFAPPPASGSSYRPSRQGAQNNEAVSTSELLTQLADPLSWPRLADSAATLSWPRLADSAAPCARSDASSESERGSQTRSLVSLRSTSGASASVAPMALRTMRPAEEVEVMLASRGTPEFVRGKTLCARVISIAGPWRRQGEWWAQAPGAGWAAQAPAAYARDYYELALADGGVYRAYREMHSDRWFVDGVYD